MTDQSPNKEVRRFTWRWVRNLPYNQIGKLQRAMINARAGSGRFYETRTVYFLVRYCRFCLFPAKWILQIFSVRFVVNIAPGTGHIISDSDHFLRLVHAGKANPSLRYLVLFKNHALASGFAEVYKQHFLFIKSSTFLYLLALPLWTAFPELALDCGLSRLKHRLPVPGDFTLEPPFSQSIPKLEGYRNWVAYYQLRAQTRDYVPMREGDWNSPQLDSFLGDAKCIAIVHIKTSVMNATALPTDPESYLPALRYLKEQGMTLVKIGGEETPQSFLDVGVIDYSVSDVANFANDLRLIRKARIVIASGSGVGWLPDLMDVPQVYANFWHLFTPPFSGKCVMVPTLVRRRRDGRMLSFSEQFDLYISTSEHGDELFPTERFDPINATSGEVLEAVKESLHLGSCTSPLSTYQERYAAIDPVGWLSFAECRISESFICNHIDLCKASQPQNWADRG